MRPDRAFRAFPPFSSHVFCRRHQRRLGCVIITCLPDTVLFICLFFERYTFNLTERSTAKQRGRDIPQVTASCPFSLHTAECILMFYQLGRFEKKLFIALLFSFLNLKGCPRGYLIIFYLLFSRRHFIIFRTSKIFSNIWVIFPKRFPSKVSVFQSVAPVAESSGLMRLQEFLGYPGGQELCRNRSSHPDLLVVSPLRGRNPLATSEGSSLTSPLLKSSCFFF